VVKSFSIPVPASHVQHTAFTRGEKLLLLRTRRQMRFARPFHVLQQMVVFWSYQTGTSDESPNVDPMKKFLEFTLVGGLIGLIMGGLLSLVSGNIFVLMHGCSGGNRSRSGTRGNSSE
jgi:hypothetical protein